jgi:hypothetical protein
MSIKLNTASGGSITLQESNTASNLTLTVPAQSGSIVTANSSGNVGIGTSSPSMGVHVVRDWTSGFATVGAQAITAFSSSGEAGYGTFDSNGTRHAYFSSADTGTRVWVNTTKPLIFGTDAVERGRFDTSGNFQFNSGYGSVATAYGCRVWVNFNGTGTVAIRNSGNVSSITDNGTGDYTVNFSSAMPDVNYCVSTSADFAQQMVKSAATFGGSGTNPTTSSIRVFIRDGGSSASDCTHVFVSIFR